VIDDSGWGAFRTLHSALERLFSGIHFGMDDWGNWRLNWNGSRFASLNGYMRLMYEAKTFAAGND